MDSILSHIVSVCNYTSFYNDSTESGLKESWFNLYKLLCKWVMHMQVHVLAVECADKLWKLNTELVSQCDSVICFEVTS